MAGKSKFVVKEHMTLPEILKEIKKRKLDYEITERLIFVADLMKGISIPNASKNIGVSHSTGYLWAKRWNELGLDGLIPRYGGGRPPELSKEDLEKLDKILLKTPNLTNDIAFDIEQVWRSMKRKISSIDFETIENLLAKVKFYYSEYVGEKTFTDK